jgi:hypothetical protein
MLPLFIRLHSNIELGFDVCGLKPSFVLELCLSIHSNHKPNRLLSLPWNQNVDGTEISTSKRPNMARKRLNA